MWKDLMNFPFTHSFQAAYSGNTLGLRKICAPENIASIDRTILQTYLSNHHTPDRMVLAGVGMDHAQLIELAEQHFVQKTPVWAESNAVIDSSKGRDESVAQYTGGLLQVEFYCRN